MVVIYFVTPELYVIVGWNSRLLKLLSVQVLERRTVVNVRRHTDWHCDQERIDDLMIGLYSFRPLYQRFRLGVERGVLDPLAELCTFYTVSSRLWI